MLRRRPQALVAGAALCVLLLAGLVVAGPVAACTLFGLAGRDVAGGGTLLVKNRDWRPDQTQRLKLVTPADGFPYLGLFATGGGASGLKAGVNAAGLSVVSATVSSIPREERKAEKGVGGILRRLLSECDSVEQALARRDLFAHAKPCFYMLADRREVARVETAPGGRFAVTRVSRGPLWQTNHYLESSLTGFNQTVGASSRTRAARIESLLDSLKKPADLDALLALSRDRADGPDNSIWRTGGTPASTRTMATFAVAMPPQGPGTLSLRTVDPGAPERTLTVSLDAAVFRGEKALPGNAR
jgi:hypothetical protein